MSSLRSLFRRWRRAPSPLPPAARTITTPFTRLSLSDWCASPERVSYAAALFKDPLFLDLVGVLASVRVTHRGVLDPTTAAFLLGQRSGQDLVLNALLAAATAPPSPPNDIPANYAAENVMADWENAADAL